MACSPVGAAGTIRVGGPLRIEHGGVRFRRRARAAHQHGRVGAVHDRAGRMAPFGDVSDALIGYEKFHEVRLRQQESVADLQESVRLSKLRYEGGTTTYLEVLDGQRSLYTAELTLAQARGSEYQSLVQVYRALGGGWRN